LFQLQFFQYEKYFYDMTNAFREVEDKIYTVPTDDQVNQY